MKITRFEDLECWQEARKLVKMVYNITNNAHFMQKLHKFFFIFLRRWINYSLVAIFREKSSGNFSLFSCCNF
jgi:hypothetical protein